MSRAGHLKREEARTSRLAREAADLTQRELAEDLHISRGRMARMELEGADDVPNVLIVAAAPERARPWAEALIRWQASKHQLQVLRAAENVHGTDHAARLASVVKELGDVLGAFSLALAHDWLDQREVEVIVRESREAVDVLLELERFATDTLQQRAA
jgi:transcriptional regulator with XRE-family HTH domain